MKPVLAKTVHLKDADATRNLGALIGQNLKSGLVIALLGDLGAGKTTLTQALANALGIQEPVSSPTFLMLSEYHSGRFPLFHFDLYRLQEDMQSPSALFQMKSDLEEALMSNSIVVVEWLNLWEEFAADFEQLRIELRYLSGLDGREAVLSASGPVAQALLEKVSNECHVES